VGAGTGGRSGCEDAVKAYVSRVLAELGLVNRVQAAILAYEAGLR
jgi:DNA-binding NarL/FixJ family response regulator